MTTDLPVLIRTVAAQGVLLGLLPLVLEAHALDWPGQPGPGWELGCALALGGVSVASGGSRPVRHAVHGILGLGWGAGAASLRSGIAVVAG